MKKNKRLAIIFFVILLVIFVLYIYLVNSIGTAVSENNESFVVTAGDSSAKISRQLKERNIITSSYFFSIYLRLNGLAAEIKAGEHIIPADSTLSQVARLLTKSVSQKERTITIIEGWTNQQIGDYLITNNIVSQSDWSEALNQKYDYYWLPKKTDDYLQGYLFPDTYRLYVDASAQDIIAKLLTNFEQKVITGLTLNNQNINNLDTIVNLAAIVEKEVAVFEDRRMVADIFLRRLNDNYPLQSDATVNYITNKGMIQPTYNDTKIKNAYNTYQNVGLPPRPISNPGLDSIRAVLNPKANEYYFFLTTKDDGRVIYSKTYQEHLENKSLYLQ